MFFLSFKGVPTKGLPFTLKKRETQGLADLVGVMEFT